MRCRSRFCNTLLKSECLLYTTDSTGERFCAWQRDSGWRRVAVGTFVVRFNRPRVSLREHSALP